MTNIDDKPLFMISVVAKMLGIHPQTLRLYEREGLLSPNRTKGNTRLYSETDIEKIKSIMTLTRDLGVNLAGVEIILNLKNQMGDLKIAFQDFLNYLQETMNKEFTDFEQKYSQAIVKAPHQNIVKSFLKKEDK